MNRIVLLVFVSLLWACGGAPQEPAEIPERSYKSAEPTVDLPTPPPLRDDKHVFVDPPRFQEQGDVVYDRMTRLRWLNRALYTFHPGTGSLDVEADCRSQGSFRAAKVKEVAAIVQPGQNGVWTLPLNVSDVINQDVADGCVDLIAGSLNADCGGQTVNVLCVEVTP